MANMATLVDLILYLRKYVLETRIESIVIET